MNPIPQNNSPPTRIDQMRRNYTLGGLHLQDVNGDPMVQFDLWFREATGRDQSDLSVDQLDSAVGRSELPEWMEPNAMTLSTSTRDGEVTSRTVLLKGLTQEHFLFYTNYESTKGRQIASNPAVSLCFFWPHLQRQVLVTGQAARTDRQSSAAYFHSRPRESQLGAHASVQSATIDSRAVLENQMRQLAQQYPVGSTVPLPDNWGGFAVTPHKVEFWQGRANRLHDRIVYTRLLQDSGNTTWQLSRVSP